MQQHGSDKTTNLNIRNVDEASEVESSSIKSQYEHIDKGSVFILFCVYFAFYC